MELTIRQSALKHGIRVEGINSAVIHALLIDDDFQAADPPKVLILGPDDTGNIIEIVGQFTGDDVFTIFHAMPARPALLTLLTNLKKGKR